MLTCNRICAAAMLAAVAAAAPAQASDRPVLLAQAPAELASGEVTKVDASARKLTIRHGPLKTLDMPAMTMVFGVSDPGMLSMVKAGDKIRFNVERVNGQLTVTRIEKTR